MFCHWLLHKGAPDLHFWIHTTTHQDTTEDFVLNLEWYYMQLFITIILFKIFLVGILAKLFEVQWLFLFPEEIW